MATVLVIIAWLLASWSLPAGSLIRPSQWSVSTPSISWEAIIHHRHHDHHPQKTHPSSTSTKTFNSANQLIIEEKLENAGEARGKAENVCSWVWLTRSGRHVGIDGIIATVLFISFNFFLSEVRHTSGGSFVRVGEIETESFGGSIWNVIDWTETETDTFVLSQLLILNANSLTTPLHGWT